MISGVPLDKEIVPFVQEPGKVAAMGILSPKDSLDWNITTPWGEVIGRRTSTNQWRYYAKDHLGSTRAVVTSTGSIVEVRDYYPYGLLMPGRSWVSGTAAKQGFTGHELDSESGLIYAGARYYIPNIGRWTGVDPLADKYPGWSPYNYVLNNPLRFVDPDGRRVLDDYGLDPEGNIFLIAETDDAYDVLYSIDESGNVVDPDNHIVINDKSLLPQLAQTRSEGRRRARIASSGSRDNVFRLFDFAARNTRVEWGMISYREETNGKYALGTLHIEDLSPAFSRYGFSESTWYYHIHSHSHIPGASGDVTPYRSYYM